MKTIITALLLILAFNILPSQTSLYDEIHRHHAGLFLGISYNTNQEKIHPALGLEYEFRIFETRPDLGIGFFAEVAFAEHPEYIAGIPVYIHPVSGLKVWMAPGIMYTKEPAFEIEDPSPVNKKNRTDEIQGCENGACTGSNTNFMMRFGTSYDFHVDSFTISPVMCLDLTRCNSFVVLGLAVGIGF